MQKRILGNGGLEVSALGLGCLGMSRSFDPNPDRQEMISLIRMAVERGVTFVEETDTSVNEQIDDAYRAKYRRYAASIISAMVGPAARPATIILCRAQQVRNQF